MFVLIKVLFILFSLFFTYTQGTQLYTYLSERCCEGTVHALPDGASYLDYLCCGKESYKFKPENGSTELPLRCCGNRLYQPTNTSTSCCGTTVFVNTTQACHRWGEWDEEEKFRLIDLSSDDIETGRTAVCGKSNNSSELYDPEIKICCSGMMHEKKSGKECCGEEYIDPAAYKCCYELFEYVITDRLELLTSVIQHNGALPNRSKCCNGSIIDAEKQECCGGVAVDFPKNYSKIILDEDDEDEFDLIYGSLFSDCCGTELVTDWKTQFCAENELIVYRDYRNQILCDGKLRTISGNESLNVYCIEGKVLTLPRNERICSINGSNVIYDENKHACGYNGLINKTEYDVEKQRTFACYESREMYSKFVHPNLYYSPLNNNNNSRDFYTSIEDTL